MLDVSLYTFKSSWIIVSLLFFSVNTSNIKYIREILNQAERSCFFLILVFYYRPLRFTINDFFLKFHVCLFVCFLIKPGYSEGTCWAEMCEYCHCARLRRSTAPQLGYCLLRFPSSVMLVKVQHLCHRGHFFFLFFSTFCFTIRKNKQTESCFPGPTSARVSRPNLITKESINLSN